MNKESLSPKWQINIELCQTWIKQRFQLDWDMGRQIQIMIT